MIATRFRLFAAAALVACLAPIPVSAQEAPAKTADHPIFKALTGKWTETGILVPAAGADPLQGRGISAGGPALDGLWFQVDGVADYGAAKWKYRWMFRISEKEGKTRLYALYIDTMGQQIQYQGSLDEEGKQFQLLSKLPDGGESRSQLTLQEDGTTLIQALHLNPQGQIAVKFQAEGKRVEGGE